jgi:hypothetical protein
MTTPTTVIGISWNNDGSGLDVTGVSATVGCKRCPPGLALQTGPVSGFVDPKFVICVNFASLAAALSWKNSVTSYFDFLYWTPTSCC